VDGAVVIDQGAIEALRQFALANGEIAFAHMCTAALNGEEWAVERFVERFDDGQGCIGSPFLDERTLNIIRSTNTDRPDDMVAKSIEVV
jgi:hypothetical protein